MNALNTQLLDLKKVCKASPAKYQKEVFLMSQVTLPKS
jgi:hypothetical protein